VVVVVLVFVQRVPLRYFLRRSSRKRNCTWSPHGLPHLHPGRVGGMHATPPCTCRFLVSWALCVPAVLRSLCSLPWRQHCCEILGILILILHRPLENTKCCCTREIRCWCGLWAGLAVGGKGRVLRLNLRGGISVCRAICMACFRKTLYLAAPVSLLFSCVCASILSCCDVFTFTWYIPLLLGVAFRFCCGNGWVLAALRRSVQYYR